MEEERRKREEIEAREAEGGARAEVVAGATEDGAGISGGAA